MLFDMCLLNMFNINDTLLLKNTNMGAKIKYGKYNLMGSMTSLQRHIIVSETLVPVSINICRGYLWDVRMFSEAPTF